MMTKVAMVGTHDTVNCLPHVQKQERKRKCPELHSLLWIKPSVTHRPLTRPLFLKVLPAPNSATGLSLTHGPSETLNI